MTMLQFKIRKVITCKSGKCGAKKVRTKDESGTCNYTSGSYVSTALEESKYRSTHAGNNHPIPEPAKISSIRQQPSIARRVRRIITY